MVCEGVLGTTSFHMIITIFYYYYYYYYYYFPPGVVSVEGLKDQKKVIPMLGKWRFLSDLRHPGAEYPPSRCGRLTTESSPTRRFDNGVASKAPY